MAVALGPTFVLPQRYQLLPEWARESLLALGLVVAVVAYLQRARREEAALRLVGALVIVNATLTSLAFASLLSIIFQVGPSLKGRSLLASASCVWLATVAGYALIYWFLDDVCASEDGKPQLLFPERGLPDRDGWRPNFADYVFVSVTTALAFGPSDTPPASTPMRIAMMSEAIVSFVTIGLVVARAFNAID
jgi:uncharacterized membrane protein